MSERYSKLFSLPGNLYATGSPVVIAAGALLKDNQTGKVLAQIKLRNISPKVIKAVTVAIYPKDTVGNALGDAVQHQYLDLSEKRDAEFAQKLPITLPDPATRAFSVEVKEVIFTDNSLWTGTAEPWEVLADATPLKKAIPNLELVRQYQLEFGGHNNYLYTEFKDIWYCDCGAINRIGETRCHHCNTESAQLQNIDWEALKQKRDARIAAEKVKAEAEDKKKAKRMKTIAIIAIPLVIIAIVITSFGLKSNAKKSTYELGISLLEERHYQAAAEEFSSLGDYKDSEQKYEQTLAKLKPAAVLGDYIQLHGTHTDNIDVLGTNGIVNESTETLKPAVAALNLPSGEGYFIDSDTTHWYATEERIGELWARYDLPNISFIAHFDFNSGEIHYAMPVIILPSGGNAERWTFTGTIQIATNYNGDIIEPELVYIGVESFHAKEIGRTGNMYDTMVNNQTALYHHLRENLCLSLLNNARFDVPNVQENYPDLTTSLHHLGFPEE